MQRPRLLAAIVVISGLIILVAPAHSSIVVSQESAPGAGDFDANVLGTVLAVSSPGVTAAAYYSYGNPISNSYNGSVPVASDTSRVFLVDTRDGLSLFVVHDSPDLTGGLVQSHWSLIGTPAG